MSADNWKICPRCRDRAKEARQAQIRALVEAYGEVPQAEYARLLAEANAEPDPLRLTFREEYEFYGAEEGKIHAVYQGHCEECGLRVELHAEKVFYSPDQVAARDA